MVIIVFGLPGSGKSYFAERLALIFDAWYVNSDRLRKSLFEHPTYTPDEKEGVYDVMLDKMKKAIRLQKNIVLDGTFYTEALRARFAKACAGKAVVKFIEVQAQESLVRERLANKREFSDADFEVYMEVKALWEPMFTSHLILQSENNNIDEMISIAHSYCQVIS